MIIVGVGLGFVISLLSLLPGVHAALILMMVLPWLSLGSDGSIATAAMCVGMGSVLSILHAAYQPVSNDMLANSDVATKLAHMGFGQAVVRLHKDAVHQSAFMILFVGIIFVVLALLGLDAAGGINRIVKVVSPYVLGLVILITVGKSSRPIRTVVICLCAGLLGFMTFNIPAMVGSPWTMLPLLGGLFMAPAAYGMMTSKASREPQADRRNDWNDDTDASPTGAFLGMVTGFLAGVGTSSLVSLARHSDMDEEEMLLLGSAGDASNNMFALLSFTLIGSTRSGVAAAVAEAAPAVDVFGAMICLIVMMLGIWAGTAVLNRIHDPYRMVIRQVPQKIVAMGLFAWTVSTIWYTCGVSGLIVFVSAWLISSQAKKWFVPNQALMVSMIGPVLIYYTGMSGVMTAMFIH